MSTFENLAWLLNRGLVPLLQSVHRGDFFPREHPVIEGGVSRSLELLRVRGLVKANGGGFYISESGYKLLELLEALSWLPEIG